MNRNRKLTLLCTIVALAALGFFTIPIPTTFGFIVIGFALILFVIIRDRMMRKIAIILNILIVLFCALNVIALGTPEPDLLSGMIIFLIIIPIINLIALATSQPREKKKIKELEKEGRVENLNSSRSRPKHPVHFDANRGRGELLRKM